MNVLNVISGALRLVGRDDVAEAIEAGEELTDEKLRVKRAFLTYLNAVTDELARGYFPLVKEENLESDDGVFLLSKLSESPLRILRVYDRGKPVGWSILPNYLRCMAKKITVKYEYAPARFSETDEYVYPSYEVSERLVQYGMAAEHCLVAGDTLSCTAWENKYRDEIENLLARSPAAAHIPPRRWI